jgi:hypothetical protein
MPTYRCVDKVYEIALTVIVVKESACLRLDSNASLLLDLKLVEVLMVPIFANDSCSDDMQKMAVIEQDVSDAKIPLTYVCIQNAHSVSSAGRSAAVNESSAAPLPHNLTTSAQVLPAFSSRRSARVLFPWSTCAIMLKFRIRSTGKSSKSGTARCCFA